MNKIKILSGYRSTSWFDTPCLYSLLYSLVFLCCSCLPHHENVFNTNNKLPIWLTIDANGPDLIDRRCAAIKLTSRTQSFELGLQGQGGFDLLDVYLRPSNVSEQEAWSADVTLGSHFLPVENVTLDGLSVNNSQTIFIPSFGSTRSRAVAITIGITQDVEPFLTACRQPPLM